MKKVRFLGVMLCSFLLGMSTVWAADYNISLTSQTVTAGNTVTLTIDGESSELVGRFNISSSDSNVASLSAGYVWVEKNRQSVTINANNAGTAVITVSPTEGVSDGLANEVSLSSKTVTITVNKKQEVPSNNGGTSNTPTRVKSSNNFLASLTIDGYELDNAFDKELLEYSVTLPSDTEKIKINAQLEDSNSSIIGTGEVTVTTGLNKFEIVVTAENGSKRTYTLSATVMELSPLSVKLDSQEYTIVREEKDLPKISEYYILKEITIDNESICSYYNEVLDYTLVALRDTKGNINYYIYNDGKYTLYKEYTFNGTTLQILDKDVSDGYIKKTFTYDGDKITGYQAAKLKLLKNTYALDDNTVTGEQFYLFYAKNVETGKEGLYQYDAVEKTVQRFNYELLDMYQNSNNTYYMYLLGAIMVVVVLVVAISLILISYNKKNRRLIDYNNYKQQMKFEIDNELATKKRK